MPARQLWAFLTDADVRELIGKIGGREPGLAVSQGRYLRGDPQALLVDPAALERRESLPGERRTYLDDWVTSSVYDFDALAPKQTIAGPAIVESAMTTVLLRPGETAKVTALGWLDITLPTAASR